MTKEKQRLDCVMICPGSMRETRQDGLLVVEAPVLGGTGIRLLITATGVMIYRDGFAPKVIEVPERRRRR